VKIEDFGINPQGTFKNILQTGKKFMFSLHGCSLGRHVTFVALYAIQDEIIIVLVH